MPRAIYWRRRLLLLAALILLAWVALQLWPTKDDSKQTARPSATPTPSASPTVTATPSATAEPTPAAATTTVKLSGGGDECDSQKVRITAFVADGQQAQTPINVDLAISTTAKRPCTFTAKTYDPLAVVNLGDTRVWDSSACERPVAAGTLQLVPGWTTVARVPWLPKRSGKACADSEPWLEPGAYTLEIGTLGGEPGKASFTLAAPPPPPPPPTPAPATPEATPTPTPPPATESPAA